MKVLVSSLIFALTLPALGSNCSDPKQNAELLRALLNFTTCSFSDNLQECRRIKHLNPRTKTALAWGGIAASAFSWELRARQLVHSEKEFLDHTKKHIQRVLKLGQELRKTDPQLFYDVDQKLLVKFLKLHDQSKVDRKLSEGKRPIISRLYDFFGRPQASLSEYEKKTLKTLVDELNQIDDQVAYDFFRKHGLLDKYGKPNSIAQKLLRIEKIADYVDRGMNFVTRQEFAREVLPASKFFRVPHDGVIAAKLEKRYKLIVKGLFFESSFKGRARALVSKWSKLGIDREANSGLKTLLTLKAGKTAAQLGMIGGFAASSALFIAAQIAEAKSTACSSAIDPFIDHIPNSCKPAVKIGPNTLRFLSAPLEEQHRHLSLNSNLCQHYTELKKKVLLSPFSNVTCGSKNTVHVPSHNMKLSLDGQNIKSITLDKKVGMVGWRLNEIHFDSSGAFSSICLRPPHSKAGHCAHHYAITDSNGQMDVSPKTPMNERIKKASLQFLYSLKGQFSHLESLTRCCDPGSNDSCTNSSKGSKGKNKRRTVQ